MLQNSLPLPKKQIALSLFRNDLTICNLHILHNNGEYFSIQVWCLFSHLLFISIKILIELPVLKA